MNKDKWTNMRKRSPPHMEAVVIWIWKKKGGYKHNQLVRYNRSTGQVLDEENKKMELEIEKWKYP